jgi:hypothetical protein
MNETKLPDTAVGNWAFATLVSEHLRQSMKTGTFGEVQRMLREQGFAVSVYNAEKKRKKQRV